MEPLSVAEGRDPPTFALQGIKPGPGLGRGRGAQYGWVYRTLCIEPKACPKDHVSRDRTRAPDCGSESGHETCVIVGRKIVIRGAADRSDNPRFGDAYMLSAEGCHVHELHARASLLSSPAVPYQLFQYWVCEV